MITTPPRSIPLPDPKALKKKKTHRPIPWALIRFVAVVFILLLGGWAAYSSGLLDSRLPQIRHGWAVLTNDQSGDHSQHQDATYTCPMHPQILQDRPGECPICGMDLVLVKSEDDQSKHQDDTYTCPMHPQILQDKPGECPICGMDLVLVKSEDDHSKHQTMEPTHPNEVYVDPRMLNNLGVRTETVQVRTLARDLRLTGEVAVDDSTNQVLQSWVAGRIEEVYLNAVGEMVKKGQPIVKIYSPQLLASSEELISALQYRDELKERDALPQSVLDAEAMVEATEKRLRLWGLHKEQIAKIVSTRKTETDVVIYSTATGTVREKMVYKGKYVKEGSPLYELIDFGKLWVYLNVFENEMGNVYVGMPIMFTTPAYEGQKFYGQVTEIEPMMDSESRTGRVRVAVSNTAGRLIPGMYVKSELEIPISSGKPTVSNLSVIRSGKRDIVIVAKGGGRFFPQEIKIGPLADGYYPVLSGLNTGQVVVSQASFLIDSESQLKAALQQLKEGESTPGGHQH